MSRAIIGNNITESMLDGLYGSKLEENLKEAEKEAETLELNGEFDEEAELRAYEKQRKLRKDK